MQARLMRLCPFLSTPSVGRATRPHGAAVDALNISIHALRGEGDSSAVLPDGRMY